MRDSRRSSDVGAGMTFFGIIEREFEWVFRGDLVRRTRPEAWLSPSRKTSLGGFSVNFTASGLSRWNFAFLAVKATICFSSELLSSKFLRKAVLTSSRRLFTPWMSLAKSEAIIRLAAVSRCGELRAVVVSMSGITTTGISSEVILIGTERSLILLGLE